VIHVAKPDRLRDETYLDNVVNGLIGVRNWETTVLLAVVAELLVDDPEPQLRCRREAEERGDHLPRWILALPRVDVYRAVRRTHVFGDVHELVLGMRLDGGRELTIAVRIDHNMVSSVVDAAAVPQPIGDVVAKVAETNSDTDLFDMEPADARALIEDALNKPRLTPETDCWPLYRPLIQWLVSRLPAGGERRSSGENWESYQELCDRFFATNSAAPFTDSTHRYLLLELFETGSGDPLRWSTARVEQAIGGPPYIDDYLPLEVALDAPDLLRAFVPFAHAQIGIRDELTARTLAMVDELRSYYKREVLKHHKYWGLDDAV
jgi:hypothetical protein